MGSIAVRYAPMNRPQIPGSPNQIPNIDWQAYFPRFKDQKGDDVFLHLERFHKYIYKLGVELHEDSLMKMFMISLEGNARSWYEGFPAGSLYSLRDFHTIFHEHFKDRYPSLLLVQDCCIHAKGFIEYLEHMYSDDELVDEELLEILHENPFQEKETQISCLHIQEKSQQLIISSSTERDMSQNSDSSSYISFLEVDE